MNGASFKTVNIGLLDRPVPPIRGHFTDEDLARLVASIKEHGILVPIMVRERGGRFEVVDGDRRLNAAWRADLREIPVVVYALDDSQTHIQRMLANLDRHDPDPVSEAKYIAHVVNSGGFTVEQFAEKLGRSLEWVEGRLLIAEMPEYMQRALSEQKISLGVCMELFEISDDNTRERYFAEALRSGMTVHAARLARLSVNEAIDALRERGEQVTQENVPEIQTVPRVRCALTGHVLPVTETRMVRVGIREYEEYRRSSGVSEVL